MIFAHWHVILIVCVTVAGNMRRVVHNGLPLSLEFVVDFIRQFFWLLLYLDLVNHHSEFIIGFVMPLLGF